MQLPDLEWGSPLSDDNRYIQPKHLRWRTKAITKEVRKFRH